MGKYEEAVPLFEQGDRRAVETRSRADAGAALLRGRCTWFVSSDIRRRRSEFLAELKDFPQNTRARAGLAMLYQATDRADRAAEAIADMLRITPTPDTYALAARLYTMFGNSNRPMPSARKRAARSPRGRGPADTPRDADKISLRRRRGGIAAALLLAALIGGGMWLARRAQPTQADLRAIPGQNVLLITIDTLRADAMSSYGGPASTPALDRIAAGGVRFTFAHAHTVLTLPSHTSIFTGEYPYQHGVRENSGYRLRARRPHDRHAAPARGLRHRRIRRRVSGPLSLRSEPGVRRVRRSLRRDARTDRVRDARATGHRRRAARTRLDRAASRRPLVRVGPPLRSARAVCPAAAVRSAVRRPVCTTVRSRRPTRRLRRCSTMCDPTVGRRWSS